MMPLALLVPLAVGGVAGAWWREQRQRRRATRLAMPSDLPDPAHHDAISTDVPSSPPKVFDDVGEVHHYQRASWYTLAFATSGSWFYPPAILLTVPLFGYNSYHFLRMLRQSEPKDWKAPLTVFKATAITGTLVTGRPVVASLLFLFSFGTRKLMLQAGNIGNNVDFSKGLNPRLARVWALRDGTEVELPLSQLHSGDIVVAQAGDVMAVKGVVAAGEGNVRQFSLRRQVKLIPKKVGDRVYPWTRLESGDLQIRIT